MRYHILLIPLILTCTYASSNIDFKSLEFTKMEKREFINAEFTIKNKTDFDAVEVIKEGKPIKCAPAKPIGFPSYMSHGLTDCSIERIEKQPQLCMYELKDVYYIPKLKCFVGFLNPGSMYVIGHEPSVVKHFFSRLREKLLCLK